MATSVPKLPEFLTAILAKARKYEIPDQKLPLIRDLLCRSEVFFCGFEVGHRHAESARGGEGVSTDRARFARGRIRLGLQVRPRGLDVADQP